MRANIRLAIETLHRKLIRSFAQRGLLCTFVRCLSKPCEVLRRCIRGYLPSERRYRAEDRDFDRQHNVDTQVPRDPGWMARIASPNWMHGIGYAPVPILDVTKILTGLDIDYQQFVFIDLGAGKGRAVLVAAQFPFKRTVGVEYSPALADVMTSNIASYQHPQQRCFELESILDDATQYELPHDPLVLFFHHPFDAAIFRQVRERIERSVLEHPREVLVIYYDPQCRGVFEECTRFRRLQQGASDGSPAAAADWVVYETVVSSTPVER